MKSSASLGAAVCVEWSSLWSEPITVEVVMLDAMLGFLLSEHESRLNKLLQPTICFFLYRKKKKKKVKDKKLPFFILSDQN